MSNKSDTSLSVLHVEAPSSEALMEAQAHNPPSHTAESIRAADLKAYTKARVSAQTAGHRAWARWGRTPTAIELRAEVLAGTGKSTAEVRTIIRDLQASDKDGPVAPRA